MKKEKTPASKERILASAVRLFAKNGFARTSMRELADDAGVNLAMINYFFGSKKELLKVILDTFFKGYLKILEQELIADESLDHKIEQFVRRVIAYISEHRDHMVVAITEMPHDDPDITEHRAQMAKKAVPIILQEVCLPIEEKSGRKISPAAIGPLLLSMMCSRFLFAPVTEQVKPPGYDQKFIKEYPEIIARIFLHGINGLAEPKKEG